eukprot:m.297419 g.297419  ORF g.297419 m.297419 type:complete len:317 (+) comp16399_c1_seq9:186-1136(+)
MIRLMMVPPLLNEARPAVCGLSNLGNTCFFNAVMQCINRSAPFVRVVREIHNKSKKPEVVTLRRGKEPEEPIEVTVDSELGALTSCLATLLQSMGSGEASSVNPSRLFNELCRKYPWFGGYEQHDSQELLRALMDGVENEEKARVREALLTYFDVPTTDFHSYVFKELPKDKQNCIRSYLRSYDPKVSAVFGGKTESSVICKNCQSVSRTVENYLDLSIPISAPKQTPANLASMDNNKSGKESPTLVRKNKKALKKEKKMQEARRKRELKPRSKLDLRTNKRRKKGGNLKNPRKAKPTKMNLTPAYTQKVSQTLKT